MWRKIVVTNAGQSSGKYQIYKIEDTKEPSCKRPQRSTGQLKQSQQYWIMESIKWSERYYTPRKKPHDRSYQKKDPVKTCQGFRLPAWDNCTEIKKWNFFLGCGFVLFSKEDNSSEMGNTKIAIIRYWRIFVLSSFKCIVAVWESTRKTGVAACREAKSFRHLSLMETQKNSLAQPRIIEPWDQEVSGCS